MSISASPEPFASKGEENDSEATGAGAPENSTQEITLTQQLLAGIYKTLHKSPMRLFIVPLMSFSS